MPGVEHITSTFHLHLLLSTYKTYATCVLLSPMFFRISRCINNPKLELTSDTHDSQFSSTISFYFFYDTSPLFGSIIDSIYSVRRENSPEGAAHTSKTRPGQRSINSNQGSELSNGVKTMYLTLEVGE